MTTTTETAPPANLRAWAEVSRDFYRSRGSRFDVWRVEWSGLWVAVDAHGVVRRFPTVDEAVAWCEQRAEAKS